jgi:DnaJ-domain-containing protein 1
MIFDRFKKIIDSELNDFLANQKEKTQKRINEDDNLTYDNVDEEYERMFNKEKQEKAEADAAKKIYFERAKPHYAALGLQPGADFEKIKDQYKRLIKEFHPDRQRDPQKQKFALEMTQKLNLAYTFFKENPPVQ